AAAPPQDGDRSKADPAANGGERQQPAARREQATATAPTRSSQEAASGSRGPVPATPATRRLARELQVDLPAVAGRGPEGRELEQLRQRLSPGVEARGGKLTLTVLVLRAVVASLREFPRVNASFDEQHQQLVLKRYYRIGVAVDTERGLVVPVVDAPHTKSLS